MTVMSMVIAATFFLTIGICAIAIAVMLVQGDDVTGSKVAGAVGIITCGAFFLVMSLTTIMTFVVDRMAG